jgi:hypothetical protein
MSNLDPSAVGRALPDAEVCPTVPPWPTAGRAVGLTSRTATYAAIARGDLPSIRIGRKIRVPTAALRRMLELDDVPSPAA